MTEKQITDGNWWATKNPRVFTCPQCHRPTEDHLGVIRYRPDLDLHGIKAAQYRHWARNGWCRWDECQHCSYSNADIPITAEVRAFGEQYGGWVRA